MALKLIFREMIHITCTAHGEHRVAENVRSCYPNINGLISNGKKSQRRLWRCRRLLRSWNSTATKTMHYSLGYLVRSCSLLHYQSAILCWSNHLDDTDAASIKFCQKVLEEYDDLEADLIYLDSNFVRLKFAIKSLEKDGLPPIDALKCIDEAKDNLPFGTPGYAAMKIYSKMSYELEKNEGL